jgi:hypothetical protein
VPLRAHSNGYPHSDTNGSTSGVLYNNFSLLAESFFYQFSLL